MKLWYNNAKKGGGCMKKLICLFLTIFVLMISLTSCSLIINFVDVEPLCLVELEEEIYFLSFYVDENYKIDFANKTIFKTQNDALPIFENEKKTKNSFEFEQFHGEYNSIENKTLENHLKSFENSEGDSLVYAFGYWQEKILVGFIQVYNGYARSCSGYDLANLDHSLFFTYDSITDTFTAKKKIESAAIVAFSQETIIYWKDQAYYSYDMQTDTEVYLIEDKAFDKGPTNYAMPCIYFNGDMCIFHLIKDKEDGKVFYSAFDFETDELFELNLQI